MKQESEASFKPIKLEDILQPKSTVVAGKRVIDWYYQGHKLSDDDRKSLKAEALSFQNGRLGKILMDSIQYQNERNMFENSKNWEDVVYCKAALFNVKLLRELIKTILEW